MEKHTKIVATISDRMCDLPFLTKLFNAGVNVFRVNTAYQEPADTLRIVESVRKMSNKIPIIIDTKGPEVRLTKTVDEIVLKKGERITLVGNPSLVSSRECLAVTYADFVNNVAIGTTILIDDGERELVVVEKTEDKITAEAKNDGVIEGYKGVTTPHLHDTLPSLSTKDKGGYFQANPFLSRPLNVLPIPNTYFSPRKETNTTALIKDVDGDGNPDLELYTTVGVEPGEGVKTFYNVLGK
jgi:pyruvate kinase